MSARKRSKRVDAASPRTDAPEHPIDPADAAFLDPAAVARAPKSAPSAKGGDGPGTPGYGDFEGERPHRGSTGSSTDKNSADTKPAR